MLKVRLNLRQVVAIAICLAGFSVINAQSVKEMYAELDAKSSIISTSGSWVKFTKVYDVPGKSKDWLYNKLANEVMKRYTQPPTTEWNDDRSVAIITANSTSASKNPNRFKTYWYAKDRLTIEVKAEKVRVNFFLTDIVADKGGGNINYYNPTDFYPNKKRKGGGLDEFYYDFQVFMNYFNAFENLLYGKMDTDW